MRRLLLSRPAWEAIRSESVRAFPEEGCGFLVGPPGGLRVEEAHPRPNVHPGPRETRFAIDGRAYLDLEDELEGSPRALLGVFHSHPLHPPKPSETDRASAWPRLFYVIQEVRGPHPDELGVLGAWRLAEDAPFFQPYDVLVDPPDPARVARA